MEFNKFFSKATGIESGPYKYQAGLASRQWPNLLNVPTGLGKTAAVTLAWLYKRGWGQDKRLESPDAGTPRRLIWCLPMRVLVEQTESNIRQWLKNLGILGKAGDAKISVHLLMGGESDLKTWAEHPEEDMILIGTQDMLLSRVLMRGYGMSRYQWPIHFALLHNDCLWVFDEVQLMGAGLATSAQLEAFRRNFPLAKSSRTLWASATLNRDWLATVDMRRHLDSLTHCTISDKDRRQAGDRLNAEKQLTRSSVLLTKQAGNKAGMKDYLRALCEQVLDSHDTGAQTLVIVNRVDRAQQLFRLLREQRHDKADLLIHARFRAIERAEQAQRLYKEPSEDRIIVATQAIEAGVDISSKTLVTEVAPWSSLVQRFGRCNRYGEHNADGATILWVDIEDDEDLSLPYDTESLSIARDKLSGLSSASPQNLPSTDTARPPTSVLRRKDLLDFFNTDPDLSGFDVDISPYIRDPGHTQSQVFWREFDESPVDDTRPGREELCTVGLGQLKDYLGKKGREAWTWDPLAERWRSIDKQRLRPGLVLLLRAGAGGYLQDQGFVADAKQTVTPVEPDNVESQDRYSGDSRSMIGRYVTLTDHLRDVAGEAERLASELGLEHEEQSILTEAGRWHDVGKAHEAFQRGIVDENAPNFETLWAKSAQGGMPRYHVFDEDGNKLNRKGFRHELASMLAWLKHGDKNEHADLIAYLIAAHHGKVRMGLRALPTENEPPGEETLYARGVWHGDRLPAVALNGKRVPETELHLDLMKLGEGPQGPSWTERTQRLLQIHGPFRLAWLEALVRIADWRASRKEQEAGNEP